MKKNIAISAILILLLMICAARVNRFLMADAGTYTSTEHGGTTNPNANAVATGAARSGGNPTGVSNGDCAVCHEQHASFGGSEPTPTGGPDDVLLMGGTGNTLCFRCHSGSIAIGGSYTANNRVWTTQTIWETNLQGFSSGHATKENTNRWPGTNPPAKLSGPGGDEGACVNCHNPHGRTFGLTGDNYGGGAQRTYLSTDVVPNMLTRVEENLCFGCHKAASGVTNARDIQSQFALGTNAQPTYYNHPVSRNSAANDRTPSDHNILENKNLYQTASLPTQTQRHVECVDCHNPHYAGYNGVAGSVNDDHTLPTNVASRILYGTHGVQINGVSQANQGLPASWPVQAPGGKGTNLLPAAPTFVSVKIDETATFYEWQLCLRCHSSYSWFDGTWAAPNNLTDVSREINPNNLSHHALVAKGNNQLPTANAQIQATYKGAYRFYPGTDPLNATVYCSDCHTSSATGDPEGPHGSARPWIVGAWCETNATYLQGGKSPNCANADDTYVCFKCHRWDVYKNSAYSLGNYGSRNPATHELTGKNHASVNTNVWQITCLSCHGGATGGGIHGTNAGTGNAGGTTNLGEHFMNGACLDGFTYDTGSKFACWTKGAADTYCVGANNCGGQHSNKTNAYNYNY